MRKCSVNAQESCSAEFGSWNRMTIEGFDCGPEVGDWLSKYLVEPTGTFRLLLYLHGSDLLNERRLSDHHTATPEMLERSDKV